MGETFVIVSNTAPILRAVIDKYLKRSGIDITPAHEADHLGMGMSLIASTSGVALLPAYAQNFLPSSVTSRPLKGDAQTVDLVLGYKKSNQSPVLSYCFRVRTSWSLASRRRPAKPSSYRSDCCCSSPHAAEIWARLDSTTLCADAADENKGMRPSTSVG